MKAEDRQEFFHRLQAIDPHPTTELEYHSTFELLVAVILSAQATDVSVNLATRRLYKTANTPKTILNLGEDGLKDYIKTIGLFNSKAKMSVDTHIFRVANRTGLALGKTPLIIERKLLKSIPQQYLLDAHHWLILHGRYTCKARTPNCAECIVRDLCRTGKQSGY